MSVWDFVVWTLWLYIFIICVTIFVAIAIDVFRDGSLNGFAKALWIVFLILLPVLGALVYLIARGRSMGERKLAEDEAAQAKALS